MVVPLDEHRTPPARDPVDGAGQPRADRLHPAAERRGIVRFDDQVGMGVLQRIVHEPEARTVATGRERTLDLVDDRYRSKRRDIRTHS